MSFDSKAMAVINQRAISKRSLKKGFTPIFAKKPSVIHVWDKFLGDHTINGYKQIGWKCNSTGAITKIK